MSGHTGGPRTAFSPTRVVTLHGWMPLPSALGGGSILTIQLSNETDGTTLQQIAGILRGVAGASQEWGENIPSQEGQMFLIEAPMDAQHDQLIALRASVVSALQKEGYEVAGLS